jgi:hypothetical protein
MRNHKFTATAPDGTVLTRSSKTRNYIYAILVRSSSDRLGRLFEGTDWGSWGWSQSKVNADRAAKEAYKCYTEVRVVPVDNPRPAEAVEDAPVDPYPVNTPICFLRDDTDDFWVEGQHGVVVESFAPNVGRNVQVEDGRVLNCRVTDLAPRRDDDSATVEIPRHAAESMLGWFDVEARTIDSRLLDMFRRTLSEATGLDIDPATETPAPVVDEPGVSLDLLRAGDLVEAITASTRPDTIRVTIDRTPWMINDRSATLCGQGEGTSTPVAVLADSIRLISRPTDYTGKLRTYDRDGNLVDARDATADEKAAKQAALGRLADNSR